jgi:hypothetical protein
MLRGVPDDGQQDGGDEGNAHVPRRRSAFNRLQDNLTTPRATLLNRPFALLKSSAQLPERFMGFVQLAIKARYV